ncbi:MAG: hypothetical protein DRN49_01420 [Thaumarchaeota archaeon]|nr:MAG: hypothetical protein DRN49_01420 [Nitrososphaerota archaeon]
MRFLKEDERYERMIEELKRIGISIASVEALSIHGSSIGKGSSIILVITKTGQFRFIKRGLSLMILADEKSALKDSSNEEFGGIIAHSFLLPYIPIINEKFLEDLERVYKRHVIIEALQNIILEHRLASTRLIIKPEYFLYDKLRRLATIYPPSRRFIREMLRGSKNEVNKVLDGFLKALKDLVDQGILEEKHGGYSPTDRFVHEILSRKNVYDRFSDELEHFFKLYLTASFSSPLDAIRNIRFDLDVLVPVRIPDPSKMLYMETSIGPQPLTTSAGIRDFICEVYGVRSIDVKLRKVGSVFNSTYLASFKIDGREEKIFVKKYLNWTDFKWIAAWLWAIGVKNFSVLASSRMSNEIYFINKLSELGFNTAEILHINWPKKIIFQKFIDGVDGLKALKNADEPRVFNDISYRMGEILAKVHEKGICIGDCNPFTFIFGNDGKIYLIDLEQCSFGDLKSWDLCELLFYTAHYLNSEEVERFSKNVVQGYLKVGEEDVVKDALDQRFIRIFVPWTPLWIHSRIRKAVTEVLRS